MADDDDVDLLAALGLDISGVADDAPPDVVIPLPPGVCVAVRDGDADVVWATMDEQRSDCPREAVWLQQKHHPGRPKGDFPWCGWRDKYGSCYHDRPATHVAMQLTVCGSTTVAVQLLLPVAAHHSDQRNPFRAFSPDSLPRPRLSLDGEQCGSRRGSASWSPSAP